MPDFKEEIKAAVDNIRSKAGAEVAEKIEDSLITIVTKANSMVTTSKELESEVKDLRAEAYSKRHALKDYEKEASTKLQDYEKQIEDLQANNNNDELTSEVNRLRDFEKETINSQKNNFKSFIENVKDHDKFSKVVNRFKLPTNDDGIDFESLEKIEYDDLKHNLNQMKDLEDLEYFDSTNNKQKTPAGSGSKGGSDTTFAARMKDAKSPKEIKELLESEGIGS